MSLDNFEFTDTQTFRVESGKLLIADPYILGYPREESSGDIAAIHNLIHKKYVQKSTKKDTRPDIIMMPYGFIVNDDTDGLWNVYQNENGLAIVDSRKDSVRNKIFRGTYSISFDKESRDKYERAKKEHIRAGFCFSAGVDLCTLLVGDADKFTVPISERQFAHNPLFEPNRLQSYQKLETKIMEGSNRQLIKVENGIYTASINRSKRRISIRKL